MAIWKRRADPQPAILDPLLTLPSAASVLAESIGFTPTGFCSVCFRAKETRAFRDVQYNVRDWLDSDTDGPPQVDTVEDSFGFTWMVIRRPSERFHSLIADLHWASSQFVSNGFGSQLLCAVMVFRDRDERHAALVYLCKRGTFYPFAPLPGERRDSRLELAFKGAIKGELPVEGDLHRWFPVWGAPGL